MSRKLYKSRTDSVKCVNVQEEEEAMKKGYRDISEIIAENKAPEPDTSPEPYPALRQEALPAVRKLYKSIKPKDYLRIPEGDEEAEADARKLGYRDIQELIDEAKGTKTTYAAVDVTPTPEFTSKSTTTEILVVDGKAEVPADAVTIKKVPDIKNTETADIADAPPDEDEKTGEERAKEIEDLSMDAPSLQTVFEAETGKRAEWRGKGTKAYTTWLIKNKHVPAQPES